MRNGRILRWRNYVYRSNEGNCKLLKNCGYSPSGHCRRYSSQAKIDDEDMKLIGVEFFFRHGERTPLRVIHNLPSQAFHEQVMADVPFSVIPYNMIEVPSSFTTPLKSMTQVEMLLAKSNSSSYLTQSGALTLLGKLNMYSLGGKMRKRYIDQMQIITGDNIEEMYCRSTKKSRSIFSMVCFISGFLQYRYRESTFDRFNLYTATPNTTDPLMIFASDKMERIRYKENLYEIYPEMLQIRDEIIRILGLSVIYGKSGVFYLDEVSLYPIRDDLSSRLHHGMYLPDEVIELLPTLDRYCTLEFCYKMMGDESNWFNDGLKSLVGPMFYHILDSMNSHLRKQPDTHPPVRFYSTHDAFLIPFLMITDDHYDGSWPSFCSYITLELYERKNGGYWVKIFYNDKLLSSQSYNDWRNRFRKFATSPNEHRNLIGRQGRSNIQSFFQ